MLITETDPSIHELRKRLDHFYSQTTDYIAFHEPSKHQGHWFQVRKQIEALLAQRPNEKVRVLEFGCGVSGFGEYISDLRPRLILHAQDVTDRHSDYLLKHNDAFHAGDIADLKGPYDIIFSTYVWEHVSNPRATLKRLESLLAPGGSLFLFCPRYDVPGYFPPSCRHLGLLSRLGLCAGLWLGRVGTMLGISNARFAIDSDPAMFHTKWYPDADAIHWVSYWDLVRAVSPDFTVAPVDPGSSGVVRRLLDRRLKLCARVSHRAGAPRSDV